MLAMAIALGGSGGFEMFFQRFYSQSIFLNFHAEVADVQAGVAFERV